MVCETVAAGLGVRGSVTVPWVHAGIDESIINNDEANLIAVSLSILCWFSVNEVIVILKIRFTLNLFKAIYSNGYSKGWKVFN